tara:strand:- start:682 stop:843 length:162 start_codon:yes stop_codon:yes gene_type:complete
MGLIVDIEVSVDIDQAVRSLKRVGDASVVGGVTYTVRNVEDDGTGVTTLVLEA